MYLKYFYQEYTVPLCLPQTFRLIRLIRKLLVLYIAEKNILTT